MTVRLGSRDRIVLPRETREAMHLKGRDELLVVVKDDITVIMPKPKNYREALSSSGRGVLPVISSGPDHAVPRWT